MDRATQLQERLGVTDRPSSSVRSYPAPAREEPTLAREEPTLVHEEPTLVHEEPTLEFSTEFLDEADTGAAEQAIEEPQVATAPPRISELDIPDFRRHQIGPATVMAAIGAAIALIVASVGSRQFPHRAEPTVETGTQLVAKGPVLQLPPEHHSPATTAAPITPVSPAVNTRAPLQQAPVATSLEKNLNAVAVTVTVIPAGAVIFRAGQKLGTGAVQVSVDHHAKQRLTALHDGYAPYNFTLDGSRETVTVRLKRAPRPEAAPAHISDSPFEGPSEGSSETPAE